MTEPDGNEEPEREENLFDKHFAIIERACALNGTPAWTQETVDALREEIHQLAPDYPPVNQEFAKFVEIFPPIDAEHGRDPMRTSKDYKKAWCELQRHRLPPELPDGSFVLDDSNPYRFLLEKAHELDRPNFEKRRLELLEELKKKESQ